MTGPNRAVLCRAVPWGSRHLVPSVVHLYRMLQLHDSACTLQTRQAPCTPRRPRPRRKATQQIQVKWVGRWTLPAVACRCAACGGGWIAVADRQRCNGFGHAPRALPPVTFIRKPSLRYSACSSCPSSMPPPPPPPSPLICSTTCHTEELAQIVARRRAGMPHPSFRPPARTIALTLGLLRAEGAVAGGRAKGIGSFQTCPPRTNVYCPCLVPSDSAESWALLVCASEISRSHLAGAASSAWPPRRS